jgi:N-formylglutamate deformylase
VNHLWLEEPDAPRSRRALAWHAPYHAALEAELDRVRKAIHGVAILYDCHSIRSQIPFLFDGTLPDFNIGTNSMAPPAPR